MNDPTRKYRRRFRAWRNRTRLETEANRYAELFKARGLHIPDEQELRRILAGRFPKIRPKAKGALNILALYHHYNWENTALKPALEKFGAVRHYDWAGAFDQDMPGWHEENKRKMNEVLVRQAADWNEERAFDLVFAYLSGENVYPETILELRRLGAPIINLALNDKESFVGKIREGLSMGARDICRHFDICWTSTEDALTKYCVEGALPVYLPEGANPDVHRPHPAEKTIDISFVGQCYGNRPAILEDLRKRGFRVEAFGYGWPNGPLSVEEMVRIYSRSRINLGFGGVDGHDETFCLKGRDFEIPMSGGLYLTEYHPELDRFYRCGEEIVTYTSIEDLAEKIRDLLLNPEKSEKIRASGFERARREHSWEKRFEKIIGMIGLVNEA